MYQITRKNVLRKGQGKTQFEIYPAPNAQKRVSVYQSDWHETHKTIKQPISCWPPSASI